MEKRIIVAFILSFAVLYGFRALFAPTQPEPVTQTSPAPPQQSPSPATSIPPTTPAESSPSPTEAPVGEIQAERAQDLIVDTPLYTATVSNTGGVLRSYKLKAYSDAEGRPLELINPTAGEKLGWPMAVETDDATLNGTLAKALFNGRQEGDRIVLEFAGNGLHARKVFEFARDSFEFSIESLLTKVGTRVPHQLVWQGGFGDQSLVADPAKINAVHETDGKFGIVSLRSIGEPQTFSTGRTGVEDQYFLAMYLFDRPVSVKVSKEEFAGTDGKAVPEFNVSATMPESGTARVYVGPKDRTWLSKADPQLASVINYGWFEFIAKPLLFFLLLFHSYTGNFGWAIIFLTLAINLLLFPLRLKQQVSMLKMQKIQPQMRTLQDKYKKLKNSDPKRAQLQAEMMDLYRQHGVNPLGGCLPLLLQMPVFIGLYSMLSVSIDLRRAPWILWIKDLSQADPLYILPILFAISMVVMQRMTPTTVDPAQAKVMMIMPLMFAVMFLRAQAGLTLYWLAGNLVGIAQQVFITKYWSPHATAKLEARTGKEARNK